MRFLHLCRFLQTVSNRRKPDDAVVCMSGIAAGSARRGTLLWTRSKISPTQLEAQTVPYLEVEMERLRLAEAITTVDMIFGCFFRCKPMDEEDCEPYTDVYWIEFRLDCNARFAKKKLDEHIFYGKRPQVSYAPHFESLSDTREKLEARRKEVLAWSNPGRFKGTATSSSVGLGRSSANASSPQNSAVGQHIFNPNSSFLMLTVLHRRVSSELDYSQSHSMNQTVQLVRDKLNKLESSGEHLQSGRKLASTTEGEFDFYRNSELPSVNGYPDVSHAAFIPLAWTPLKLTVFLSTLCQ